MHVLHDYQLDMLDRCSAAFRSGKRSVCAVMPTGAGKTLWAVHACLRHLDLRGVGASIVWLAPLRELVDQAKAAFPSHVSVVTASKYSEDQFTMFPRVHISTVHALAQTGFRPRATMLVLDEAQYFFGTPEWNGLALEYRAQGVPILSLTATPARVDGAALANLADELVIGPSIKDLVDRWRRTDGREGLVPPHVFAPPERLQAPCMDPVAAYLEHAPGTKAVVFCADVEASKATAAKFQAAGIPADSADAKDRDAIEAHKAGHIRVLVNVFLVSVGYNDPTIDTVILMRGVSNPSTWIQIVGRPLRPSPGKRVAYILDLLGNVHQHGLPEESRAYSLHGRAIRLAGQALDPLTVCPACTVLYRPGGTACGCGPEIREALPKVEKPPSAAKIRKMELQRILATEPETVKRGFFQVLKERARYENWPRWKAEMIFKDKYGHMPPREWS